MLVRRICGRTFGVAEQVTVVVLVKKLLGNLLQLQLDSMYR